MNTYLKFSLVLILILFVSCEEMTFDLFDSYENQIYKLEITNVESIEPNTIIVTGKITQWGNEELVDIGIKLLPDKSINTEGGLKYAETLYEDSFKVEFYNLAADCIYKFQAFAVDTHYFTFSDILEYKLPIPKMVTTSCDIAENTLKENETYYNINTMYAGSEMARSGKYRVSANTTDRGPNFAIEFNQEPVSGIYNIKNFNYFKNSNTNVVVILYEGVYEQIGYGGQVFVMRKDSKISVTICGTSYKRFSGVKVINANMVVEE